MSPDFIPLKSTQDWLDQNFRFAIKAETKPSPVKQNDAWLALYKHADFSTDADAHFFEAMETTTLTD